MTQRERRRISVHVPVRVARRVERFVEDETGMTLGAYIAHQLGVMDQAVSRDAPDEEQGRMDVPAPSGAGYL
jgi:hypothetical protein